MLTELLTRERFADLERERTHLQLLRQVPKTRHLARIITYLGMQIVALGTWMQHIAPANA